MSKAVVIFILLLVAVVIQASAQDSLRDQALDESAKTLEYQKTTSGKKAKPSEVVPKVEITPEQAGVLQLEDPFPESPKNWRWFTSLSLQNYTPVGTGSIGDASFYDYSTLGATPKMLVSLGVNSRLYTLRSFDFNLSLAAELGFSSKDVELISITESKVPARIQSIDLSLQPGILIPVRFINKLSLKLLAELGYQYFSVASRNSLARFNDIASFYGSGFGLQYTTQSRWALHIQHIERTESSAKLTWTPSSSNTQLGASYLW